MKKISTATNCTKEEFLQSTLLQDAVSNNFLILGEAANRLSAEFQGDHPEIPWRIMVGMRNILIHDYVRTNYALVWQTIQQDLPELSKQLQKILLPDSETD